MAALPSPTQVAGSHNALYEAYWNQVDPNGSGTVGAIAAARFLKRSGLSDVVLSRVWDLSDPGGRGCLDKAGFFVALKLVSIAQIGKDLNMINISLETPPPKMGDPPPKLIPPQKPPPPVSVSPIPAGGAPLITALPPTTGDWSIKPSERVNYDKLFDSLQPLNGMIPGNKVKGVLMESKLPLETLGKIWDLADVDKDGMLDRHEFVVAMHLVYKALEKHAIPATLPPELMPPNKRVVTSSSSSPLTITSKLPPPARPQQPLIGHDVPQQPSAAVPWVVSGDDKNKYDAMFLKADIDKDGFVNGFEIKDVFLQSGVPQSILAHIWALCDIKQTGKLNNEQFALAMWMVNRKLQGVEPPAQLTSDMIPPSMRSSSGIIDTTNKSEPTVTPYSNPELDMISKDIDELAKEKLALETDIAQKEADIKIKGGEIKSLQSELDTLTAALKQLENQKGEAQKRLNDLRAQSADVEKELADVSVLIDAAQVEVDKLRLQAEEQEVALRGQESEVSKKREQLESLRKEQEQLEAEKREKSHKLNQLSETLTDTQLQISQAKAKITQLQEQQRLMKDAINACDYAIENNNATLVADTSLRITPEFRDPQYTRVASVQFHDTTTSIITSNTKDPFSNQNGHSNISGFDEDPFKSDPFKSTNMNGSGSGSGFDLNDPFVSSFNKSTADGFDSDPFAANFDNNANTGKTAADPFDPFGDKNRVLNAKSPAVDSEKDQFGCDPFAILHAPTRDGTIQAPPPSAAITTTASIPPARPTSPSPALPPKKGKTPPPRPAPPRPTHGPTGRGASTLQSSTTPVHDPFAMSQQQQHNDDPFANNSTINDGFADFADFDSKFTKQTPTKPAPPVPAAAAAAATVKLEFTDDPFRDYRYEDPFNIADPFADTDQIKTTTFTNANIFTNEFETDIKTAETISIGGGGGRTSVPLLTAQSNNNQSHSGGRLSAQDPFFVTDDDTFHNNNNRKSQVSEDQQLKWAASESLKAEEERKRRQQQEQADFEYALALSKAETKS